MSIKHFLVRRRARASVRLLAAAFLVAGVCAMPHSDVRAQASPPAIAFHFIGAGEHSRSNFCYRLSASVAQAAPGYSSGSSNFIIAGFQAVSQTVIQDEIFFNGFEDC